jgi:hypothetical protein
MENVSPHLSMDKVFEVFCLRNSNCKTNGAIRAFAFYGGPYRTCIFKNLFMIFLMQYDFILLNLIGNLNGNIYHRGGNIYHRGGNIYHCGG